jgi:CRP-like cAMP-binding protein
MNEVVFFRNDPANALYLVKSGKVSINVDIEEEFELLNIVKSGGAFGESALLTDSNRIYTSIIYSERAELYVLPKVNIHEIFEGHSSIRMKMIESLGELYYHYMVTLFKSYKSSIGLFDLSQIFSK